MTEPTIAAALAEAFRADLLRAADPRTGRVIRSRTHARSRRSGPARVAAWLGNQLRRPRPVTQVGAVTPVGHATCAVSR